MNIKDYTLRVSYLLEGRIYTASGSDENVSFTDSGAGGSILLEMKSERPVTMLNAALIWRHNFACEKFYSNGYQSWTTSREYAWGDEQKGLLFPCNTTPAVRDLAGISGDYSFTQYGRGLFHSHTYTYLRKGEKTELFGTLNDRTGYTVFYANMNDNYFVSMKDVEGLTVEGSYELFNIVRFTGSYDEVFDKYFAAYPEKSTGRVSHLAGYTSWYNYFQKIDEDIILRDLYGLYDKAGDKANIFQIDDGYESMVGDWQTVDPVKFPSGMKHIADEVHKKGYMAGLWLAPFSAQFKAKIVKEHPEWLIKNEKGKNMIGGFAWNGFYVLDIELPEVRDYIRGVFDTVFNDWGFDMVKLDFLYSAAIVPRNGKTRGQLMHEAMDFLRECCGDKLILGCGVPLGAAWGKVDACRISCDVELSFKEKFYTKVTNQEIVSAKMAMNNSIFRRHLDGRIFANDPDVFFLRDDGMKPAVFTWEQKLLLARINHMFGSVLFVSDNAGAYSDEKTAVLLDTYKKFNGSIQMAEYTGKDTAAITYSEGGKKHRMTFSFATGECKISDEE